MLTPTRIDTEELLDEHDAPQPDMERSLRDLRRINRWLGGRFNYRRLLQRLAPGAARLRILDVGAGTCDNLDALDGDHFRIGLDFKIDHLLYQRAGSRTHRVVGDAHHLPFRDGSVDVVTSAHFFHHFSPDENVEILRDALRVARVGVTVNDTRRHYVPLLFIQLLSVLRLVGRITRFDGPASVLRGYTVPEVKGVAGKTGAARASVVRAWPFRFGLLLWKMK
ncbi:MAG TPA: methyltransferase domain-containing protein [Thermoanaerobaculia bacterium]